jgi:hypothetical protein
MASRCRASGGGLQSRSNGTGAVPPRRVGSSSAVRREVPVRTFDGWSDPPPGFCEVDLVLMAGCWLGARSSRLSCWST